MIHDAIKEGDEEFLAEVLEALNKKYNLGAYLKREDKRERNICIGEENTNNGDRKESEDIMEDPNQVSSEKTRSWGSLFRGYQGNTGRGRVKRKLGKTHR